MKTIAQEQFISNIINSSRFTGHDYKVSELSNGYILLEITLENGVIRWAVDKEGRHDPYYFGPKGFDEWHKLFYN